MMKQYNSKFRLHLVGLDGGCQPEGAGGRRGAHKTAKKDINNENVNDNIDEMH